MTTLVVNTFVPDIMAGHGSQDHSRDEESARNQPVYNLTGHLLGNSIVTLVHGHTNLDNMNEILYSQGHPGISFTQMDPLADCHTGSPWEGQQNFHSHSGENGNTDSYQSVTMSRDSNVGAVSGMDTHSFSTDMSGSYIAQDYQMGTLLERWISQNSRETIGSPPTSIGTVTPVHLTEAKSVELRPSLSQMSHHSGITDRSFSLPDTGLYPTSLNYSDNQLYSESKYIDDIDSSVGHGSYHNGDSKGLAHRPSHLMMSVATGSSYPAYSSPEQVMFTSPMDVMSQAQAMFEPSITHDNVSATMDPLNINDSLWTWDPIDQTESGGSTPFSSDMAWPSGSTKSSVNYSPNGTSNSPRANRKAMMVQQNGRVNGDRPANYHNGFYDDVHHSDRSQSHGSVDNDQAPRDHQLYQNPITGTDGLYHCPWEKDPNCNHKPEKLKCNYDKFVDSHLKPYHCKVLECEKRPFSSTACLLRHEREAHAMHGHGEKPFLCTFEGCERAVPGHGFPRHWNLCDHMKRVHNRSPSPTTASVKPPKSSKKRKNSTGETSASKKSPTAASSSVEKPRGSTRSLSLSEQFEHGRQQLLTELMEIPNFGDIEATQQHIEKAANLFKQITQTTHQMRSTPRMERRGSHQSG